MCTGITRYVLWLCFGMHLEISFFIMMGVGMELGVVATHAVFSRFPINEEVFLFAYISNPIKTHVYGFGYALFDGFIDDA